VDFDPNAVKVARSHGLDVRQGSVDVLDPTKERFDGITLSHVIEHVHDPLAVLRQCHALLKPGGWLWIETPNIDAQGHTRYGANWRGLEPPRHLVLFNHQSLSRALWEAGFKRIADQPYRPLCETVYTKSETIQRGEDPYAPISSPPVVDKVIKNAEQRAKSDPTLREFITFKAWKDA
jgi:SAM-dependent methyltransferase